MSNSGSVSSLDNSKHTNNNNNKTNSNDLYAYYSQQQNFQYNTREQVTQLLRKYCENETMAPMDEESENDSRCRLHHQVPNFEVWASKSLSHMPQIIRTNNNIKKPKHKVLPKLSDRDLLKLRSTTNGFILHSGGTISGRKEHVNNKIGINNYSISNVTVDKMQMSQHPLPLPMLERTLMYNMDSAITRQPTLVDEQHIFLRRMQTELELPSSSSKLYTKNTDESILKVPPAHIKKNNKYKKKRRAPLAPNEIQTVITANALTGVSVGDAENLEISDMNVRTDAQRLAARRLFRLQCNKKQTTVNPELNTLSIKKTETTGQMKQEHLRHPLLNKYSSQTVDDTTASMLSTKTDSNNISENNNSDNNNKSNNKNNNNDYKINANDKNCSNVISVCKNNLKVNPWTNNSSNIVTSTSISNNDIVVKPSKMPQLKQTFFFGLAKNVIEKPKNKEQLCSSVQLYTNLELPTKPNSAIDKSGLVVHVLPTLPRRQFETPSFSPVYAWQALAETQLHMQLSCNGGQHANSGVQDNKHEQSSLEQSIKIQDSEQNVVDLSAVKNKKYFPTWIPQQDLGGDDEDGDVALTMHITHDFEMQSDIANLLSDQIFTCNDNIGDSNSSKDETNNIDRRKSSYTINNNKNSVVHTLHVFNMFLPRETHMNSHIKQFANDKFGNYSKSPEVLKFVTSNNDAKDSVSFKDRNDNWMLYKSHSGCSSLQAINKNYNTQITTEKVDWSTFPASIEPHFLTSLTKDKHLMYLPSVSAANNRQSKKSVSQTVSRFDY